MLLAKLSPLQLPQEALLLVLQEQLHAKFVAALEFFHLLDSVLMNEAPGGVEGFLIFQKLRVAMVSWATIDKITRGLPARR